MRNIYEVNGKTYIIELEPEEFNTFTKEFISNPDTQIFSNKIGKRMAIIEIFDLEEPQVEILETLIGNLLDEFSCVRITEKWFLIWMEDKM